MCDTYLDHVHLMHHAEVLFPSASIKVVHTDGEVIHIDVNGRRFTFEIGSDDDAYVFTDGDAAFTIPLMENPEEF